MAHLGDLKQNYYRLHDALLVLSKDEGSSQGTGGASGASTGGVPNLEPLSSSSMEVSSEDEEGADKEEEEGQDDSANYNAVE